MTLQLIKPNSSPSIEIMTPEAVSYLRGKRYRDELEAAGLLFPVCQCDLAFKNEVALPPLRKVDRKWEIAVRLAGDYDVSRETIRDDCLYAAAVDNLVSNCGERARDLILRGHPFLSSRKVGTISRMAPPRQRYELEQVAQGHRPFKKPSNGIAPFDTTGFKEVISRLRRARGSLAKGVRIIAILPKKLIEMLDARAERIETWLEACIEDAQTVMGIIRVAPARLPCNCGFRASSWTPKKGTRSHLCSFDEEDVRKLYRGLGSAKGLIAKNVRDLPRRPKRMRPTEEVKALLLEELNDIVRLARQLLQVLRGSAEHGRPCRA